MAVLVGSGANSVENFTSGRLGNLIHEAGKPRSLINPQVRTVDFVIGKRSRLTFTDLSYNSLLFSPRIAPSGRCTRCSAGGDQPSTSNSDEGIRPAEESSKSLESQDATPYVPGNNNKRKNDSKGESKTSNAAQKALERAAAYKAQRKLRPSAIQQGQSSSSRPSPPPARPPTEDLPQVEIIRGQDVELNLQNISTSESTPAEKVLEDKVEKNFGIARSLEQNLAAVERSSDSENSGPAAAEGKQEPVPLSALSKARAYQQQQTEMVAALREGNEAAAAAASNPPRGNDSGSAAASDKALEIEIVTRDGVIKRKVMNAAEQVRAFSNVKDVKRKGVSGIDFVGLGFADKKKSGRPAGLSEGFAAPPSGPLPEIEIFTREAGSSEPETSNSTGQQAAEQPQLYKPRVSSWGVFARPADISKTYGGGRTIRPGESLETEEERKIRESRTQQLLADYRKKMGLDVDPAVKAEAEQICRRADRLMDAGRLRDSLLLYELAMRKMPPKSELHGLAALNTALCLDSLSRYEEARQVYEKLLTHPTQRVSKQAKRFLFGFKAAEELKVGGGSYQYDASVYRKYFASFADGYDNTYKAEDEEQAKQNLLPYALLLLFPILLVFALAASKSG